MRRCINEVRMYIIEVIIHMQIFLLPHDHPDGALFVKKMMEYLEEKEHKVNKT